MQEYPTISHQTPYRALQSSQEKATRQAFKQTHPHKSLVSETASSLEESINKQNAQRAYYHGSPEEALLKEQLGAAKKTRNGARIGQARRDLHQYWEKVVDEDYQNVTKESLPGEIRELQRLYHRNPYDPLVQYKLQSLAARAEELGVESASDVIEWIETISLKRSSPTGSAIAEYALNNAMGNGHQCYHYVANALENVGIYLRGGSAYLAANQLAKNPKMIEIRGLKAEQLATLPKGAIVVWNRSFEHYDGHISISLGDGNEVSDIVRAQLMGYGSAFRVFVPMDMLDQDDGIEIVISRHEPSRVIEPGDAVSSEEILKNGLYLDIRRGDYPLGIDAGAHDNERPYFTWMMTG